MQTGFLKSPSSFDLQIDEADTPGSEHQRIWIRTGSDHTRSSRVCVWARDAVTPLYGSGEAGEDARAVVQGQADVDDVSGAHA